MLCQSDTLITAVHITLYHILPRSVKKNGNILAKNKCNIFWCTVHSKLSNKFAETVDFYGGIWYNIDAERNTHKT